jgi:hypothetical protein
MEKMPPRSAQQIYPPELGLCDAIEEMRDLVSAVEWLIDSDPESATHAFELRRVRMRIASAKELVTKVDREQEQLEGSR